jgi:hypothetical protein
MPLDPHDTAAKLTGLHETSWWGIAEQVDDMTFRVTRHADYDRVFGLTDTAEDREAIWVWILGSGLDPDQPQPHIVAPGTPGARRASTSAMVSSGDRGQTWVFCATGWTAPEVIR